MTSIEQKLDEISDSRFNIGMPFNWTMLYLAIEEIRKETSIEFFKWCTEKENYSAILRNNPSNEKQYKKEFEEAEYFDCLTPEERYNLFIKSLEEK